MNEGSPSIVDIIAPGKTELSEEEWTQFVVLNATSLRHLMQRTTPIRLSAHLGVAGVDSEAMVRVEAPCDNYLLKRGSFFSTKGRYVEEHTVRFCTWGVCQEDDLFFLGFFKYLRSHESQHLALEVLTATPAKICGTVRETGEQMEYYHMFTLITDAIRGIVHQRRESFQSALAAEARAHMLMHELAPLRLRAS